MHQNSKHTNQNLTLSWNKMSTLLKRWNNRNPTVEPRWARMGTEHRAPTNLISSSGRSPEEVFKRGSLRLYVNISLVIASPPRQLGRFVLNLARMFPSMSSCARVGIKQCEYGNEWAATWQNQQSDCAPSEDSDQAGHPPSLIRVFVVCMEKAWVFSYQLSASKTLIRLGGVGCCHIYILWYCLYVIK